MKTRCSRHTGWSDCIKSCNGRFKEHRMESQGYSQTIVLSSPPFWQRSRNCRLCWRWGSQGTGGWSQSMCITFPNFSWDTLLGKGTSPFLLAPEPVGPSAYSTCNVSCWSISVPTGPGKRQEEITCHPSLRNILIPASTTCYLTLGATYWTMMMITLISSFCRFVVSTGKLLLQKVGLTGILERLHPRPRLHRCAWAWMKHCSPEKHFLLKRHWHSFRWMWYLAFRVFLVFLVCLTTSCA